MHLSYLKHFITPFKYAAYLKGLLFFSLVCCLHLTTYAQNEPFNLLMKRINADLQTGISDKVLTHKVSEALESLNPDGSWKDIDYANLQYDPLKRIKEMAMAYIRPSNPLYVKANVHAAIVSALQNWLDRNPRNKNWWFNDIFYPQAIGQILILMRNAKQQVPNQLEEDLIQRMKIAKFLVGDGANTSDEALHYLYRACLTKNKSTMDSAATYLFEPISIIDGKGGVQVDGSYYQHGKQQAIASYGKVFVGNSVNAAYYLRGTEYALPQAKFDILLKYLKHTFIKTIRGSFFDFNVRGRGISRRDSLESRITGMISKIEALDPQHLSFWQAAAARTAEQKPAKYGVTKSHNQYWKSGYTLSVRPAYTFSVQTASTRTLRTERGNNENILGKFLPDGATNIQRTGSEYANIMPIWEWDKIPGTTSRDYATASGATILKDWGIEGTTKFVGGASDGLYGVSAYDLNYDDVQGKKSWFFFDKEIVCLGAGIKSNQPEHITTTVNQTWLRGEVTSGSLGDRTWIVHDSIGYFFPKKDNINITEKKQSGSWYRINHFQQKDTVIGSVFKVWIDHGAKPQHADYAYTVVPAMSVNDVKKYKTDMIAILKNTKEIQAVKHTGLNMLQVVFYKAGTLEADNLCVKVDKPCVVYIKSLNTAQPMLYIADPTQENENIKVEVKLSKNENNKLLNCTLPVGPLAGSTASFKIN
ncbi:polysaccharide lyase family 8 super-sandwich domain-containing protein [Pedobacter endophyticus]|uniref:Chondroitinase n=1 Tax=Pedobacter endophyticus TaxID=2789740 RepID=A0A7S9KY56_9SPHI|nr:polysaccharide lyase family 8 super-sandwich domain-containing protein [Pedobacter endophyticus]QPH38987.1 chondroitinase [Pedobacter endophyticus]